MKALRFVLWALLGSLIFGLLVGTAIRLRLEERPERYLGESKWSAPIESGDSKDGSATADPLGFLHARAVVFEPRQGEEEIG